MTRGNDVTRVYSAQNTLMVDHLKLVLDAEGIGCVVRNRLASSALGRIPAGECWTELWVLDDEQEERARRVVEAALDAETSPAEATWVCRSCGERLDPQFEACWKCATFRGADAGEAGYGDAPPPDAARPRPISAERQLWLVWGAMAVVAWYLFRSYAH